MLILNRISHLTCQYTRSIIFARAIHVQPDPDEKVVPLSKFDLSKPLIGRTNGMNSPDIRMLHMIVFLL